MTLPRVVILGAGPAGLGAAFRLTRRGSARVTVLERNGRIGGNAGSFELAGCRVDYGSHRLHPACAPEVLADIRAQLGEDLLDRPRHGRIRLRGRWIHFPLQPVDLARRLPPSMILGVTRDGLRKALRPSPAPAGEASFASALEAALGPTMCREFYFPYARKIWGLAPEDLAAVQAQRRVSAGSLPAMLRRVWAAVPGVRRAGAGRFYYPRFGYGQISDAYARAAREGGADIQLDARVVAVETRRGAVDAVHYERAGRAGSLRADHVLSTIPITTLVQSLQPPAPVESLRAAERLPYRAMILVYLVLEQPRFSEWDAHYFPEPDVPITRLSEPKNYTGGHGPDDLTVLCAELPCAPEDAVWGLDDGALGRLVSTGLDRAGLPVRAPVKEVLIRRLRHAYPIYGRAYRGDFDRLDHAVAGIDGLTTFGRQGLFAHDNTHHALFMAYRAVDCLRGDGTLDRARWAACRREFETHVVED
jgi:protoporphyrinogen oxidase